MSENKYYEANLALKAAEDALVVDTTNMFVTPNNNTSNPDSSMNVNPNSVSSKLSKATNSSKMNSRKMNRFGSNAKNTTTGAGNNMNNTGTTNVNTPTNGTQNQMN
jgi:hypothetical protein